MMMSIGQAGKATHTSPKAIRHLEAMGLLPPVHRRGTYRMYDASHIQAIALIRQAQALGFTLAELRALGREDCTPDWPRFLQAISHKREALARQIDGLRQRDAALAMLAETLPALLTHEASCDGIAAHLVDMPPQLPARSSRAA